MYNFLKFFRGTESDLNLIPNNDGVLTGTVHLDPVSTGLYETVNLFIMEEVSVNQELYLSTPISNSVNGTKLHFRWNDDFDTSKDIFIYSTRLEDSKYYINVEDSLTIDTLTGSQNTDGSVIKELSSISGNEALQVNIALMSFNENRHHRILNVYEETDGVETLIAEIKFYGETEGEDERLRNLLENLGATLDDNDFILFKEHDITEMAPDYILLNQKRKELLLNLHEIKPFVGTYKAILNAIDFFGYNNITLKEYWLNIDDSNTSFGKLKAIPVANSSKYGDLQRKGMMVELPSSTLKKTSRFSLVYKINVPNGEFDYWDIPQVDEVLDFTPEEVLIKLYGLKAKLQREYLPLNAKIIDIVGEGDYFAQKNLNIWNNQNYIGLFTEGIDIKFKVLPEGRDLFIEDFAHVLNSLYDDNNTTLADNYNQLLNLGFSDYDTLTGNTLDLNGNVSQVGQRAILTETYNDFYNNYYNKPLDTFNQDIPIGCPITLDATDTFETTWEEANFVWNDAVDPNETLLVTWNNWWMRSVYEIEWLVTGPRGYSESFRGPTADFVVFPLALPYNGMYSVEMRTYDLFGHRSYDKKTDLIEVKLKELELYGIYTWTDNVSWNDSKSQWTKTGGYWDLPMTSSNDVEEAVATFYHTLDRANYLHDDNYSVNTSMVRRYLDVYSDTGYSETSGPYQWNNCEFSWLDGKHNWWDNTRVGMDRAASFKIVGSILPEYNLNISHRNPITGQITENSINISNSIISDPTSIALWQELVNNLNSTQLPIFNKFEYNLILIDADGDGFIDYGGQWMQVDGDGDLIPADGTGPLVDDADDVPIQNILSANIIAVGKNYTKHYDFVDVWVTDDNDNIINGIIKGKVHQKTYNPTYDNVNIFRSFAEIEKSTHVTISTDITKMAGIKKPKWTITNKVNPEINDIYYDDMWLTYVFQYSGNYSIKLEVEDTNGNINTIERNMLKVK